MTYDERNERHAGLGGPGLPNSRDTALPHWSYGGIFIFCGISLAITYGLVKLVIWIV